eukprot:GHVL01030990.1.p1 GENE.GHVL01030990.1~~GHVL01030990.1.p1  ORF type:complete len:773 (+),score=127.28 GHVL01030990.1:62-2380(+)
MTDCLVDGINDKLIVNLKAPSLPLNSVRKNSRLKTLPPRVVSTTQSSGRGDICRSGSFIESSSPLRICLSSAHRGLDLSSPKEENIPTDSLVLLPGIASKRLDIVDEETEYKHDENENTESDEDGTRRNPRRSLDSQSLFLPGIGRNSSGEVENDKIELPSLKPKRLQVSYRRPSFEDDPSTRRVASCSSSADKKVTINSRLDFVEFLGSASSKRFKETCKRSLKEFKVDSDGVDDMKNNIIIKDMIFDSYIKPNKREHNCSHHRARRERKHLEVEGSEMNQGEMSTRMMTPRNDETSPKTRRATFSDFCRESAQPTNSFASFVDSIGNEDNNEREDENSDSSCSSCPSPILRSPTSSSCKSPLASANERQKALDEFQSTILEKGRMRGPGVMKLYKSMANKKGGKYYKKSMALFASISSSLNKFKKVDLAGDTAIIEKEFSRSSGVDISGIFGVGYVCRRGMKPDMPNQDSFFVIRMSDFGLYGVFDGHGPNGHDVSDFVHRQLPQLLLTSCNGCPTQFWADPHRHLKKAFSGTQWLLEMYATKGARWPNSGTSATVIAHQGNRLIVAHVGDSRTVIGRRGEQEEYTSERITDDHCLRMAEEVERIEKAGGEVRRLPGHRVDRVFFPGKDSPGLNMTRSLGDVMCSNIGIISDPTIREIIIEETTKAPTPTGRTPTNIKTYSDHYKTVPTIWSTMTHQKMIQAAHAVLVMGSDGVWEFIGEQEAVNCIVESLAMGLSIQEATEELVADAWNRWLEVEKDIVDDITAIAILL